MKRGLWRWLWLAVSTVVVGLILYYLSRNSERRSFHWDQFWATLTDARPGFLVAAVAVISSTYFIRAYRWKLFLDSIKKASLWVLFVAQVLGFSSIYLIGRPGEIVRPAYIAKREEVSFTSQLALWLLERIYDSVFLVFSVAVSMNLLRVDAPSRVITPNLPSSVVITSFTTRASTSTESVKNGFAGSEMSIA